MCMAAISIMVLILRSLKSMAVFPSLQESEIRACRSLWEYKDLPALFLGAFAFVLWISVVTWI